MSAPIVWLVEAPRYPDFRSWAWTKADADFQASNGYTVTPLVAAPPPQTVEEAREFVERLLGLALGGIHGAQSLAEFKEAKERLVTAVACAAPPEGAPSYSEITEALRQCMEACRSNLAYAARKDEQVLHAAFLRADAMLSRIPKMENAT